MERALKLTKVSREPLVVVVLGPTASGKTALALAIARRFGGEIVNCDSVAMYREFEIGTAKPSAAERAEVAHHLVDCVDPVADVSAGEYARQARQILCEIVLRENVPRETALSEKKLRRHLPIVSGGTGLYLRALLEGLFPGPQRSEQLRNKLRARAEERGTDHLHRILRRLDTPAANRIHANDVPKVIRAIEVCLTSRHPSRRTSPRTSRLNMTELWQQGREPLQGFRILRLGLNPERKDLYARINQRAAKMFDSGLIVETERLLAKYGDQARPISSLGYKQALQFLRGELDRESVLAAAQQAHRNYAKRQITWFRCEPDVRWLAGFGDDPAIQTEGMAMIEPEI
ncbi:MAG TPA: tRNA (adenosine(37)-N6)-dimethylallyltransferase MiaA [Terriglobales bacterium]